MRGEFGEDVRMRCIVRDGTDAGSFLFCFSFFAMMLAIAFAWRSLWPVSPLVLWSLSSVVDFN